MPVSNVWLRLDGLCAADILQNAVETIDTAGTEAVLDFTSVERIDARALKALEELANTAGEKGVSIALDGVNVGVYKALKLMKLTQRFSFLH